MTSRTGTNSPRLPRQPGPVGEPSTLPEQEKYVDGRSALRPDISVGSALQGLTVTIVAIGVMAVYVAAPWLLFEHRADKNWDRVVYLFSGFEAVVFVAVGALFGTRVQRASVETAHAQAHQARTDARSERDRADAAVTRGEAGSVLATGVRSFIGSRANGPAQNTVTGEDRHSHGIRGKESEAGDPGLAFLAELVDTLFPRDR
jgi:hypothetical protein